MLRTKLRTLLASFQGMLISDEIREIQMYITRTRVSRGYYTLDVLNRPSSIACSLDIAGNAEDGSQHSFFLFFLWDHIVEYDLICPIGIKIPDSEENLLFSGKLTSLLFTAIRPLLDDRTRNYWKSASSMPGYHHPIPIV